VQEISRECNRINGTVDCIYPAYNKQTISGSDATEICKQKQLNVCNYMTNDCFAALPAALTAYPEIQGAAKKDPSTKTSVSSKGIVVLHEIFSDY